MFWAGGIAPVHRVDVNGPTQSPWYRVGQAPGVESLHAVRARATEAVLDLAVRAAGESAVAVSHDVVLREILTYLSPSLGYPEQLTLDTGCLDIVELNRGKATIVGLNQHPGEPETSRQP